MWLQHVQMKILQQNYTDTVCRKLLLTWEAIKYKILINIYMGDLHLYVSMFFHNEFFIHEFEF